MTPTPKFEMKVPDSIDDLAVINQIAERAGLKNYNVAVALCCEPDRMMRTFVAHDGSHPDPREPGNEYFSFAYEVTPDKPSTKITDKAEVQGAVLTSKVQTELGLTQIPQQDQN